MNQQSASNISEATIRRFLLARLSQNEQSAFEASLFANSQLEKRVQLAEIALIDDYTCNHLSANEREAFRKKFLVTTARRRKLEVSTALRECFPADAISPRAHSSAMQVFTWPHLAWRLALAIVVVTVLLAGAWVVRREPQIVKRIIPKRLRPVAIATPTPQAAHHAADSSEPPVHRDQAPALPAHEASPLTIILHADATGETAPIVSLAGTGSSSLRLQLMLERNESATFSAVLETSSGEFVYRLADMAVAGIDRVDLEVPIDRLKPGDYQIQLVQIGADQVPPTTYHFRVH